MYSYRRLYLDDDSIDDVYTNEFPKHSENRIQKHSENRIQIKNYCDNCGAPVNRNKYQCDYCGTNY